MALPPVGWRSPESRCLSSGPQAHSPFLSVTEAHSPNLPKCLTSSAELARINTLASFVSSCCQEPTVAPHGLNGHIPDPPSSMQPGTSNAPIPACPQESTGHPAPGGLNAWSCLPTSPTAHTGWREAGASSALLCDVDPRPILSVQRPPHGLCVVLPELGKSAVQPYYRRKRGATISVSLPGRPSSPGHSQRGANPCGTESGLQAALPSALLRAQAVVSTQRQSPAQPRLVNRETLT